MLKASKDVASFAGTNLMWMMWKLTTKAGENRKPIICPKCGISVHYEVVIKVTKSQTARQNIDDLRERKMVI